MSPRRVATFGLALALVHVIAGMPFYLDGGALSAFAAVTADEAIVLGVALLGLASGWRRTALHGASVLLVGSALFGVASVCWHLCRDRPFEWGDVGEISGLPNLLFGWEPLWWTTLLLLLPVLLILHCTAYFSLVRLVVAPGPRGRIVWVAILQALVIVGAMGAAGLWQPSALGAMARETARMLGEWAGPRSAAEMLTAPPGAGRLANAPADLAGLDGADVHVLFVESYGRVAFRHPEVAAHLRALWPRLEDELRGAGFSAVSGACYPAVSGGASLLAHAQLFTGVKVPDFRTWERLQHCGLRPLPQLFLDAGYHTVESMPAMPRHWPEGAAFFGFAEQTTQLELQYDGFAYHFGLMPDQFALHHLIKRVIEPAKKPVFSTYVSVTSHLPCTHIPPYIADWNITNTTFRGAPRKSYGTSWFNARSSSDTVPAYRDAVAYSMQCAVGFAARLQRPSIVIVVGDHQPPIKTVLVPEDSSLDVPLHVFANRPALLEALAPLQLRPGLDVADDVVAFDSADFGPRFVRAFSRL